MSENLTIKQKNEIEDSLFKKQERSLLFVTTAYYVQEFAHWHSMVTLTMDNEHLCSRDKFYERIKFLIRCLNKDLYGHNYIRSIGHSYFSYVLGFELTTNQVLHAHMLVSHPIDFSMVHKIWNKISGFAYITKVDNREKASRYISKYVTKDGDLIFFKSKGAHPPLVYPSWWTKEWR